MNQNNIPALPNLTQDRYENIFNVYTDENDYYYYNLLESIVLPQGLPDSFFNYYVTTPGDTLPFVSYKNYGTINLWWAICVANNIINPTQIFDTGTSIKIPTPTIIREIIKQINYGSQ